MTASYFDSRHVEHLGRRHCSDKRFNRTELYSYSKLISASIRLCTQAVSHILKAIFFCGPWDSAITKEWAIDSELIIK
jgi:hypothetical protein